MKTKPFILFFFFVLISHLSNGQIKLDPTNPNAKHDEVLRLTDISVNVNLPLYVINELKEYAKSAKIQEKLVMRYDYIFKAMVNQKLKKEECVFVCDYFLQTCKNCITGYPITLIQKIKQSLVSKEY